MNASLTAGRVLPVLSALLILAATAGAREPSPASARPAGAADEAPVASDPHAAVRDDGVPAPDGTLQPGELVVSDE